MDTVYITAITPEKNHMMALYAGDEIIVTLDSGLVAEKGLAPQREYAVDTLRELLTESQFRRTKSKALRLLGFRDYSVRELSARLRKDFDGQAVNAVIEYLVETGVLDDARYAEVRADYLAREKHFGRQRIRMDLLHKGIARELAEQAVEALELDEKEAIRELLQSRANRDFSSIPGIRRTIDNLKRYGYQFSDIWDVLMEIAEKSKSSPDDIF